MQSSKQLKVSYSYHYLLLRLKRRQKRALVTTPCVPSCDRFLVSHRQRPHVGVHLVLLPYSVHHDFQVKLTHPSHDYLVPVGVELRGGIGLIGVVSKGDPKARVFPSHFPQGLFKDLLLGHRSGFDSGIQDGVGDPKVWRQEVQVFDVTADQEVTGPGFFQAGNNSDLLGSRHGHKRIFLATIGRPKRLP